MTGTIMRTVVAWGDDSEQSTLELHLAKIAAARAGIPEEYRASARIRIVQGELEDEDGETEPDGHPYFQIVYLRPATAEEIEHGEVMDGLRLAERDARTALEAATEAVERHAARVVLDEDDE